MKLIVWVVDNDTSASPLDGAHDLVCHPVGNDLAWANLEGSSGHDISRHRELVTDMELARPIRQGAEAFYLSLQIALK